MYTECSYEVSAHIPYEVSAHCLSPPSLIACGMQIEHEWPGKSSKMNDTSGTQEIARHMEVVPDEGSQGPSSIHPGVRLESIHNVDSINTALLGIDIYKKCYHTCIPP